MDTLTQLMQEHAALRARLERIASAAEARDAAALAASLEASRAALTEELNAHIALEEAEAFAPIATALGEDLVAPFFAEHVEIRALRDDIYAQLAQGKMTYEPSLRLCELIEEHQQREDLMLFPSARDALSG